MIFPSVESTYGPHIVVGKVVSPSVKAGEITNPSLLERFERLREKLREEGVQLSGPRLGFVAEALTAITAVAKAVSKKSQGCTGSRHAIRANAVKNGDFSWVYGWDKYLERAGGDEYAAKLLAAKGLSSGDDILPKGNYCAENEAAAFWLANEQSKKALDEISALPTQYQAEAKDILTQAQQQNQSNYNQSQLSDIVARLKALEMNEASLSQSQQQLAALLAQTGLKGQIMDILAKAEKSGLPSISDKAGNIAQALGWFEDAQAALQKGDQEAFQAAIKQGMAMAESGIPTGYVIVGLAVLAVGGIVIALAT